MRRWIAIAAVVLIAAASGVKAARAAPSVVTPVCRFIRLYRASENENAPMHVWERLIYAFILAKEPPDEPDSN